MRFTERAISSFECPAGSRDRLVFDAAQKGLGVRITATGGKTYIAQYTIGAHKRRLPLGSCSAISLALARQACQAIMGEVANGGDPAAERNARRAAERAAAERERLTLAVLADSWRQLHLANRRPSYAREAVRALERMFASAWARPAEDLDRASVVRALDALAKTGRTAMAARTAAYGRACYQWAIKRGALTTNPFAALPAIDGGKPTRERVLTDDELAAVWRAAAAEPPPVGIAARLLMLTGQRRDEVASMRWNELSDDLSTWTIAGARTKNGRPHLVPLASRRKSCCGHCRARLMGSFCRGRGSPYSGWTKAKKRLDGAAGVSNWRLHDLRRTLATGLQRLGVRLEVTEAVLNHISGSRAGIVGVYQRHNWANEKKAALAGWAEHVMAAVDNRAAVSNIIPLAG